ncbi:MAG TPA: M14 family metallocarboxypeptidase [Opitutaceae bacterium]
MLQFPTKTTPASAPAANDLRGLLRPLLEWTEDHAGLIGSMAGVFAHAGRRYGLPRFMFSGPEHPAMATKRIAVFAGVHGDEPAGCLAAVEFLEDLLREPERATGYDIVVYPVCNPTGYEDGTRHNRAGRDLNREFWHSSEQPEVHIVERELRAHRFDGIIALHADDTSDGLYGYALGRFFNENLLRPALLAAERFLPRNMGVVIDGFAAREGVIDACYKGVLSPPPDQDPLPFEIIFETPALAPLERQATAGRTALHAILAEYRRFLSYAADL